ncbi:MAG: YggS family pyridoxal phosphate-dependent enzyme [Oscillospiraceae bacterium]|jgi:pyridoxal phosphate enzyme (YggS family)|nr:YggS family pyridoxal phosphate-dependent enzyme [Oscillospiraceae bacterium]
MTNAVNIEENAKKVIDAVARAAERAGRAPEEITLVAASKTNNAEAVRRALGAGITVFGENRVQEMVEKNAEGAYEGAELHFIGHLQKNKVNKVVGLCSLIQSVDSKELLAAIDYRARSLGIIQDLLLEINIGGEASKSGLAPEQLDQMLEEASKFDSIRVRGLMTIPPFEALGGEADTFFFQMHKLFIDNSVKKYDNVYMDFLSMGMSGDFERAIEFGANMVRVGSAIFGAR